MYFAFSISYPLLLSSIKKAPLVARLLNEQLINPNYKETFLKVPYEKSKVV